MKTRNLALGIGGVIGGVIAYKFATRPKTVEWNDVSHEVSHSENSDFIEVDGISMHFQQFGEAKNPALLLIHGYTASTFVWKTVAPKLAAKGFRVIAVDLIGFGFSGKPNWFDYSIVSQARVISRFMDRLGLGRATIVGSSYGGAIAATLALDYPARVEKLVLVNTVANDDVLKHPMLQLAKIPGVGEVIAAFAADTPLFVRQRLHNTLAPENYHLITRERIKGIQRPLNAADAHNSVLMTARHWSAKRIEIDAHLINQPTLIIWGEKDIVIPIENGRRLHEAILNSRMVVFRNCGHIPQEEASENFVKVVSDFCRSAKGKLESVESESMRLEEPKVAADDINVVGRLRDALKPA